MFQSESTIPISRVRQELLVFYTEWNLQWGPHLLGLFFLLVEQRGWLQAGQVMPQNKEQLPVQMIQKKSFGDNVNKNGVLL